MSNVRVDLAVLACLRGRSRERRGRGGRVGRTWSDSGTNYSATYTWSLLGLSGYSNTGISEPKTTTSVTSWIIRAPDGTPVAQRSTNGNEYYYLFDGAGDVVGLEDPGVMQAAYDFCPTGNTADLASTTPTAAPAADRSERAAEPPGAAPNGHR